MISVIIPTCNRRSELLTVLECISSQALKVDQVIVIDSSDSFSQIDSLDDWGFSLIHKQVKVKSAAIQRNIGMDLVSPNSNFLCFLDDDVQPLPDYMLRLVSGLNKIEAVGISGIALNPLKQESMRQKPTGLYGIIQRIFGLDSNCDGKLLRSGVNIPVRTYSGEVQNVEWLIGCSLWRYKRICDLRFESDFLGQSLSEDVIFSIRAAKRGELLVDPNVHLAHSESEIGRLRGQDFWAMWVVNRRRVVAVGSKTRINSAYFHFANLGQLISLLYSAFFVGKRFNLDFIGIFIGYWRLIMGRVKL